MIVDITVMHMLQSRETRMACNNFQWFRHIFLTIRIENIGPRQLDRLFLNLLVVHPKPSVSIVFYISKVCASYKSLSTGADIFWCYCRSHRGFHKVFHPACFTICWDMVEQSKPLTKLNQKKISSFWNQFDSGIRNGGVLKPTADQTKRPCAIDESDGDMVGATQWTPEVRNLELISYSRNPEL